MLYDNLPVAMPWYNSLRLQDRFRQNVEVNKKIAQLAPNDGILPFQIRKNPLSEFPTEWVIKCCSIQATLDDYDNGLVDDTVADLSDYILDCFLVDTLDGMDVLTFLNRFNDDFDPLGHARTGMGPLPEGYYYMQATFSDFVWTSELFRVPETPFTWDQPEFDCLYPCLKWYHGCDLKPIHYTGDDDYLFYNLLYLDTFLTASEPQFLIEGDPDGRGELIATFKKLVIKYRLSAFVPDFIKIAIYAILMHDFVFFFTERKLRQGQLKNLEVSHTLSVDGAYSTIELLFEQMSLITKSNCCDNMVEPDGVGVVAPEISTGFCEDTGDIEVTTTTFASGYYGALHGRLSALDPWVLLVPYLTRTELVAGWTGNIGPGTGYTEFKIEIRTFGFTSVDTAVSVPTDTCP